MDHQPGDDEDLTVGGFAQPGGLPGVPIVLGVIGHREVPLAHRAAVAGRLRWLFEGLKAADPRTPIVVLTGLAEGADQLAAEVARECGAFVRAVLPFDREAFRQGTSFDDEKARETLDGLLNDKEGVEWFVAPLPEGFAAAETDWSKVASDRNDPEATTLRHACYANVGGYIARRCHALIAVWDQSAEAEPARPSGTAEHVAFKLTGKPPKHYPWADSEPLGFRGDRGLVLSIHSPRKESADLGKVGELRIQMPGDKGPTEAPAKWNARLVKKLNPWRRFGARVRTSMGIKPGEKAKQRAEFTQFREVCQCVRDFNRDVARPEVADKIKARLARGFDVPQFNPINRRRFARLCQVREAAAEVSEYLRPRQNRVHVLLFALIGLSALAFHIYAHWFYESEKYNKPEHLPVWLVIDSLLVGSAFLLVAWDWLARLDQRRLDARALGEALRVRRAWARAGIGRSVADSYASQLRGEFSWVRKALMHVSPPPRFWADQFAELTTDQKLGLLREVREDWITGKGGQIRQFGRSYHRHHRLATNLRMLGFTLALAGWFTATGLLLTGLGVKKEDEPVAPPKPPEAVAPETPGKKPEPPEPPPGPAYPSDVVLIVSSLLLISGGLLIAFSERQAHEELSRQYERMEIVFLNGEAELEDRLARGEVALAQAVIEELGREAIAEHAEWYMLRRARSLELHIG